jgi:uncharacterized membrane protein YhaH (DUF805 family)
MWHGRLAHALFEMHGRLAHALFEMHGRLAHALFEMHGRLARATKLMANLRAIISMCLLCLGGQMLGLDIAIDPANKGRSSALGLMIACASSLVLLVCTSVYAARKGYHPLVGVIASIPLLGLLVLVLLPDLTKKQPQARGFEVIPTDEGNRKSQI